MPSALIVGCGVFGLSTALELSQKGYEVIAIDAYPVPSPWSAACDYNKIIRTEYDDEVYAKLSIEALHMWRSKKMFKDVYKECGRVLVTPESHTGRKQFEARSIALLQKLGEGTKIETFTGGDKLGQKFDALKYNTVEPSVEMKWNPEGGFGHAANALKAVFAECCNNGVQFRFGAAGEAKKVVVKDGIEYVETANGSLYTADHIIISSGAQTGNLVDLKQQQAATGLFVTHIRLTEDEAAKYKDIPIIFDSEMGYFFPPDKATNVVKIALAGSGASNYIVSPFGDKQSLPRYKSQNPGDTMPKSGIQEAKKLLAKYVPELAYHKLFDHKACWIADTADSNFIIDRVPGFSKVMVATGDSGHAFKLLPNIGKYIVQQVEKTLDPKLAQLWKWKDDSKPFDPMACEWRVSTESLDFATVDWVSEINSKL